jgi:apolipoprotein N-acyltransferase
VSVGVIQPNIDPNLKFTARMRNESLDRLIALSRECHENVIRKNGDGLDLIIWPETAVPAFIKSSAECRALVAALCDTINVPIFTGTPIFNYKTREVHNGAVLFVPNQGIRDEYIKIHLVPFGEHIPFDKYVPLFRKIDLGEGDYAPGSEYTVFNTGSVKFSCLVCFESIFPELSREFVKNGCQLLANITNDGWFGKISGPQQHNDMAILRTVENDVPLARSANTGISMIVDHRGRVIRETRLFEQGYLAGTVTIGQARTLYNLIGDLLPILSLLVIPGLYLYRPLRRNFKDKT